MSKKQTTLDCLRRFPLCVVGYIASHLTDQEWLKCLSDDLKSDSFRNLESFLQTQYELSDIVVYPPRESVFQAYNLTPLSRVKVVILGQDPYHQPKQAMGLSFSVPSHMPIPSSLQNIFKEIESEIPSWKRANNGDLTKWAQKGVLLLNSCLTVEGGDAGSHAKKGWETFTDKTIEVVAMKKEPVVFLLWGAFAKSKESVIDKHNTDKRHLILSSAHPSGLSAHKGFFGNGHFQQTIDFLKKHNIDFDWSLD